MQIFTPSKHNERDDNNTVLVLRDEIKEKKTDGGLYYADRAVELASQGEVRASVEGSQYEPGDRIVFVKYAGAEIELNGVDYLLLKEKEIQGTVREIASATDATPQTSDDVNAAAQEALALLAKTATDTTQK